MAKGSSLHPKAYLTSKRNVKAGLRSRSRILTALEKGRKTVREITKESELTYECVAYHLNTMKKDHLVDRMNASRPFSWGLTPYGQQKLQT